MGLWLKAIFAVKKSNITAKIGGFALAGSPIFLFCGAFLRKQFFSNSFYILYGKFLLIDKFFYDIMLMVVEIQRNLIVFQ